MTGQLAIGKLTTLSFWLNVSGVNITFWPLFVMGLQGMPRRYFDYAPWPEFAPYHQLATIGAFIIAVGMAVTIVNWLYSAFNGRKAEANPWRSQSLEWTHCLNPPGPGNFPADVIVSQERSPYNYAR